MVHGSVFFSVMQERLYSLTVSISYVAPKMDDDGEILNEWQNNLKPESPSSLATSVVSSKPTFTKTSGRVPL
jgi:hypothetical protein